jgi:Ca2+-binding EF-hand superfamily protein
MSTTQELSQREREDLERIFALLDTEQRGRVSFSQLRTLLQQVVAAGEEGPGPHSQNKRRPALERVLRAPAFADSNNTSNDNETDRELSFRDFVQLLTTAEAAASPAARVFRIMDVDGKGYIDVKDLQRVAADLGEAMEEDELEEMIARAASMPEGRVTLADLEAVLHQKLFA